MYWYAPWTHQPPLVRPATPAVVGPQVTGEAPTVSVLGVAVANASQTSPGLQPQAMAELPARWERKSFDAEVQTPSYEGRPKRPARGLA